MARGETILRIKNLSVGYPRGRDRNALFENLDLALHRSEFVCFMGPNGIGKSTLLRTLCGLHQPFAGSIEMDAIAPGQPLSHAISVVLTDRIEAMNMSAYELVSFGRYPYVNWSISLGDRDRQIINDAIDKVHIRHLLHRKVFELSDGQRQMVMIARALAQDTPIMLLDEPTAHLDLNNRLEIMKLLRDLAHTLGKAIVVSTHELDLALQTADHVWLAGKDKGMVTGIPEDLVLQGAFDDIFQFKGFDLRTGKVRHDATAGKIIAVTGEGYEYLWTKNALERNGYHIAAEAAVRIQVQRRDNTLRWSIHDRDFHSIVDLLAYLRLS
ncbi:MAG TPA: ABC transporter ATP-binding protein [Ohtaekwangia sp.]|nr:ABC transporter ATP-binding protein [Ohtaekwangia sp.]